MTGVKFDCFASAYRDLVQSVRTHGVDAAPRGQAVTELRWPHMWHITDPSRWTLMVPGRKYNIFFALAEVVWMWSGKGGADFISFYNKSITQFLDDGIPYFHGSYGRRVRMAGYDESPFRHTPSLRTQPGSAGSIPVAVDQLTHVIRKIQGDPHTRQAVVSLWDPAKDNLVQSKDHPCLGGDTVLTSPEGNRTIQDLAKSFALGELQTWPIVAFDPATKQQVITCCTNVWKSGSKPVFEISFDDGSSVVATGDHRFYLKQYRDKVTCSEVRVNQLKVGDRVWASSIWSNQRGYLECEKILGSRVGKNVHGIHRAYAMLLGGPIPSDVDIHHVDGNKQNNTRRNLVRIPHGEHAKISMSEQGVNPMCNLTPEQHKLRAQKQSKSLSNNHANRTQEQKDLTARKQSKTVKATLRHKRQSNETNHVITRIQPVGTQDVFDFTVPFYHNARLGNGVFTHNCNNLLYFQHRDGKLNMTVVRRSNDLILGVPYNMCQFVHLQALVAGELGYELGHYSVMANNLHFYHDLYPHLLQLVEDWALSTASESISDTHNYSWPSDMEWGLNHFTNFVAIAWEPFEKSSRAYLDNPRGTSPEVWYEMQRISMKAHYEGFAVPEYWVMLFNTLMAYHALKANAKEVFTDMLSLLPNHLVWQILDFMSGNLFVRESLMAQESYKTIYNEVPRG